MMALPMLWQGRAEDFRAITLSHNSGKGGAVLAGLVEAERQGFTHALVMDADGQHPAEQIAEFMAASMAEPDALVLLECPSSAPRRRRCAWSAVEFQTGGRTSRHSGAVSATRCSASGSTLSARC